MSEVMRYDPDTCAEMVPADDGQYVESNDFDRVTAERDALQQRLTKTDERNDELSGMLQHLVNNPYRFTEAYREQIAVALKREPAAPSPPQPITEQFLEDHLGKMPERIKGMIAARGGEYAIMIDENNGHYGWTFRRDPNGMWVSGRKATDAEMQAARQYARHTNQQ